MVKKINIAFHFTNTGKEMLIIKEVAASCGCTVPEKPEAPIAPGKSGIIKATFDSKSREGMNHKVLSVYANTQQTKHDLVFDVEVIPAQLNQSINKTNMMNSILLQAAPNAGYMQLVLLGGMVVVFYFFMIRPQAHKSKKSKKIPGRIAKR